MKDEDKMINELLEVWKFLDSLRVSLHRLGAYQRQEGIDKAKDELYDYMSPPMYDKICDANKVIIGLMNNVDSDIYSKLENLAEDETQFNYWSGSLEKEQL